MTELVTARCGDRHLSSRVPPGPARGRPPAASTGMRLVRTQLRLQTMRVHRALRGSICRGPEQHYQGTTLTRTPPGGRAETSGGPGYPPAISWLLRRLRSRWAAVQVRHRRADG